MRYLAILFCFLSLSSTAQHRDELKDTILFTPADWEIVASLDSIGGTVIDTIEKPKGFVVQLIFKHGYEIRVALAVKNGFKVFNPCPELENATYECSSIDFDGKRNPELLVRWTTEYGTTCWGGGFYDKSTGYCLWDLDKMLLIFSFQDSNEFYHYTEEDTYDTNAITGEVTLNAVENWSESGGFICDVQFSQQKVVIDQEEKPENWASGDPADLLDDHYEYRYTREGLVRVKSGE